MTTKPSPEAVDAFARAMSWMHPLAEDEAPSESLTQASEIMIMRLKNRGYTITSTEPAMSDAELEASAKLIATMAFSVSSVSLIGAIAKDIEALAKKYRGKS
jgi:hypothetical protein